MDLDINAHVVDAGDDTCGGDDDDNVDIKTDTENEISENSDDEDDYESCQEEDKDRVCYPEFAFYQARFVSFCKMPDTVTQSAQSLAKAGLFYEGRDDTFKCFCCGGEIYKWNSNDDPYRKHATKYPDCSFVKDVKTQLCMDRVGIAEVKVDDHVSSIDDLADCLPPAYGNHSCSSIPTEKSKGHLL